MLFVLWISDYRYEAVSEGYKYIMAKNISSIVVDNLCVTGVVDKENVKLGLKTIREGHTTVSTASCSCDGEWCKHV